MHSTIVMSSVGFQLGWKQNKHYNLLWNVFVSSSLFQVYVTRKLGRHLATDRVCLGVPRGEVGCV